MLKAVKCELLTTLRMTTNHTTTKHETGRHQKTGTLPGYLTWGGQGSFRLSSAQSNSGQR